MSNKKNSIFLLKYYISKKKDKGMLTIEREKKKPPTSNCVHYESPLQGGRKNNAFLASKSREFAANIPAL